MRILLFACIACGSAVAGLQAAADLPPKQVITGDVSTDSASVSLLERQPWAGGPWYYGWGLQSDVYSFGTIPGLEIRRLQDVAAQLTLQYFIKAEEVAAVTLMPGLYFENHPDSSCWDIPIDLETAIPIAKVFNGVIGFSNARFYHHALPIIGFVWDISPRFRLEAVYPEPALVITLRKELELRLAGQLIGGGFETDARPLRTRVEYYAYRVGMNLCYEMGHGLKLSAGGGNEVQREFDFYQAGQRIHAKPEPYAAIEVEWSR
jgi:hypothetical protein